MSVNYSRQEVAYHEAGHVIMDMLQGGLPRRVTIEPTETSLGGAHVSGDHVLTLLAGGIAQIMYTEGRDSYSGSMPAGADADYIEATEALESVFNEDDEKANNEFYRLYGIAEDVFLNPQVWLAVEHLANRLLVRITLEDDALYDELESVLNLLDGYKFDFDRVIKNP